ncbi:hypothetical protein Q5752_000242 [Cryptotrichosporon argae]
MVPSEIHDVSPLDPLLLLPVPGRPPSPSASLLPVLSSIRALASAPSSPAGPSKVPLLTSHMRLLTRNSQVLLNAGRVRAAEARDALDRVDVGLREVEYERARVRDEIAACEAYASAPISVDLQDIDTFMASNPTLPNEADEGYAHALALARLEHELAEITAREERLAALIKERDGLVRARKEIKTRTDTVNVYLADYAKTTSAVSSKVRDVLKGV